MGPIPGAQEEMDRLGRALRSQMTMMIDDLTPGSDLSLLFLNEPRVVDWHEPPRYRYAAEFSTGKRPAHVSAADIASRAAALLSSAGWRQSTTTSQDNPGRTPRIVVTGRHDNGCTIEIPCLPAERQPGQRAEGVPRTRGRPLMLRSGRRSRRARAHLLAWT
ncbi:hypothetical protein ACFU6I_14245 [Streptomyces sp. NPDC057486]|uniref:hypothetical protein n=1 Tax=Streptomyces sp. NPDC057486 TaxID=3346145 RepID=UPI0036ADC329